MHLVHTEKLLTLTFTYFCMISDLVLYLWSKVVVFCLPIFLLSL